MFCRLLKMVKCYLQWSSSKGQHRQQFRSYAFPRDSSSKCKRRHGWMHVCVEDIWLHHSNVWETWLWELVADVWCFFSAQGKWNTGKAHRKKRHFLMIPPGCTSKCQPMDVCLDKPFKTILRKCWVEYVSEISSVRSGSFYKSCMENASKHIQNNEAEEEDLFDLSFYTVISLGSFSLIFDKTSIHTN